MVRGAHEASLAVNRAGLSKAARTTHADGMATMSCQLRHGPLTTSYRTIVSLSFSALEACSPQSHFVSYATTCHISLAFSTGM